MASKALGYILSGLGTGLGAYAAQKKANEELALKKRAADLEEQKINEEKIKQISAEYANGLMRKDGGVVPNPDYFNPESDVYKLQAQRSKFKQMESATGPQYEDMSFLANNPVVKELGVQPDSLGKVMKGGYLGEILKGKLVPNKENQPILTAGEISALKDGKAPPNLKVPAGYATMLKPAAEANPTLQTQVEKMNGVPPGSYSGLPNNVLATLANQTRQDSRFETTTNRLDRQFNTEENRRKQEAADAATQKLADRMEKSGIPEIRPYLEIIDKETGLFSSKTPNLKKLPGPGTNTIRGIPLVGDSAANLAAKKYGGDAVNQAIQELTNLKLKQQSGTAVTKYEMGRQMVSRGIGIGGTEKDVQRGLKLMYEALQEAENTIVAGSKPQAVEQFTQRGGGKKLPPLATSSSGGVPREKVQAGLEWYQQESQKPPRMRDKAFSGVERMLKAEGALK